MSGPSPTPPKWELSLLSRIGGWEHPASSLRTVDLLLQCPIFYLYLAVEMVVSAVEVVVQTIEMVVSAVEMVVYRHIEMVVQ